MQDTLSEKTYRELRRRVPAGEREAGSRRVTRALADRRRKDHRIVVEAAADRLKRLGWKKSAALLVVVAAGRGNGSRRVTRKSDDRPHVEVT